MDVKVGQVWQQRSCGIRCEVAAVNNKECVLNTKYGYLIMSISGAENYLSTCVLVNETEKSLSDLEIVQKALKKSNATLIYLHNAAWEICSHDYVISDGVGLESLLTWAKQTIGVE